MSHEIDKQSLSIFFARKCDFWSQGIQWIYIELYRNPQAIVWDYMNFNRYPHIGRWPTCRWLSSSVKPLWLHSMHFIRAFPFIHWCCRGCKLLASMWVSLASFILKVKYPSSRDIRVPGWGSTRVSGQKPIENVAYSGKWKVHIWDWLRKLPTK